MVPPLPVGHGAGHRGVMDDEQLEQRLLAARQRVQEQQRRMRDLRRRLRTAHAHASALRDTALVLAYEARGRMVQPPVPPHPPDDLLG